MINQFTQDGGNQKYFGIYPAIVTDLVDPEQLGRVEVRFPWLGEGGDRDVRAWATIVSPYADNDQGLQILPEVDTQVVVAFEAGNLRRPYVMGACWNGRESMPAAAEATNNIRLLKTRSGSELEFDDTNGATKVTLRMTSGHQLEMDNSSSTITLRHATGHLLTFTASGAIELQANSTVELTATAFNIHSPVATFDGIVNCTSLNASVAVTSPMYSPGVGNVW